jgi:hypothetical protein
MIESARSNGRATKMFAILFSILVLVAILSACSNIVIRVRLTKVESSRDKLVWWRRSSDEAGKTYRQLFPGSYLPQFIQATFWIILAAAAVTLFTTLWSR